MHCAKDQSNTISLQDQILQQPMLQDQLLQHPVFRVPRPFDTISESMRHLHKVYAGVFKSKLHLFPSIVSDELILPQELQVKGSGIKLIYSPNATY